jgi:hypothetical protein
MLATLMQLPPFHTADEMRGLSNLAHVVEGVVLAIAALIALAEAAGRLRGERGRIAWPAIILFAGVLLLGYLLIPHHGLANARAQWGFVFGVPQQHQHLILAALIVIGGGAELLSRRGRLRGWAWSLIWPATAATAGILFGAHPQHGTSEAIARALMLHRWIGTLLIVTGAIRTVEVLGATQARWAKYAWPVTLLASAVLLAIYREPPGAYEPHTPAHGALKRTTAVTHALVRKRPALRADGVLLSGPVTPTVVTPLVLTGA